MTQELRKRKNGKFIERFLRLFPAYRELEKTIRHKDDALNLSSAIIQTNKNDLAALQKKIVSDSNLIISLNRHIEALEGKAAMQAELIQELKEKLNTLLAIPGNKNEEAYNG
ncbi:MAG: hypothetical protein LBQ93_06865 [Treponema sp.]|nr:hypothetical protein [Treponema sp.]